MENDYILNIRNISKKFPGVKALDSVSLDIERGTVHAIVGENGAGKSTLIKILAGILKSDSGSILFDGKEMNFKTPYEAQTAGISVVHQELKLAESLSVAENIFLGKLIYTNAKLVDWRMIRKRAKSMIDDIGIDIDVDAVVETLSIAKKQIVEICKAIAFNCKILIMDEPSATLTEKEQKIMFEIIKRLKTKGITIIYISHRLEEIFYIADNVTVLRDGKLVSTNHVSTLNREKIITMMVGREIGNEFPKECMEIGDNIIEVNGLNRKGILHDINFCIRKGEVLGIAGLIGSGRTELVRAILGIDHIDSGEIILKGKSIIHKNFGSAIKNKLGLVPEDRKLQGILQIVSVKENICLVSIDKILKGGIIDNKAENSYAKEYIKKLRISVPSINVEAQQLSGGNQQKVVIAKWLLQGSEIIFLDEPTRGIDVGAKVEIYKMINELIKEGKTVVMVSSELPEILGMSDRIIVMHRGRIVGTLSRDEVTQEKIISLCV